MNDIFTTFNKNTINQKQILGIQTYTNSSININILYALFLRAIKISYSTSSSNKYILYTIITCNKCFMMKYTK